MIKIPPEEFARAVSAAFVADMARPAMQDAIDRHGLGPNGLARLILADLDREARGKGPVLFPSLRTLLRSEMNAEEIARIAAGGMGQWAELAMAVTTAASSYLKARTEAKTVTAVAKYDVRAQEAAAKTAEIQALRERQALLASQGAPQADAGGPTGLVAGIPSWVPYAAGGAALLGLGYLLLKPKRRGR